MQLHQSPTVSGVSLPRRRFTGWAALYFLVYFVLPVLGLALILDVIFYLIFTDLLDSCYGVLCLLT
jgi:hypothetical protein